jgi:hypothetical protein
MEYAVLLYVPAEIEAEPGTPEWQACLPAHKQVREAAVASGYNPGGKALHAARGATTLRIRDGERMLTDGPFAETKEQLWGFLTVDAPDLDSVIELASGLWEAQNGSIEIRPVATVSQPA